MNRYAQMISELKTPEVMKRLTYLYGQRGGMLVAQSARYSRLLKRHEELVGYEGPIAMVSAPGRTEFGGNHTAAGSESLCRRLNLFPEIQILICSQRFFALYHRIIIAGFTVANRTNK